jgi:hypothetical protein
MMRQTTTDNATRVYTHGGVIWPQPADVSWLEGMLAAIPDDVLPAEATRRGIVWKR